jgi:citrate synthase
MSGGSWLSADEATRLLRIRRATLYAYVSRGYVRSQSTPGPSRERQYARDDVERLRRRIEARRDPDKAAARALQWGVPVLESAITAIDGARLYYRGHDVETLARTRSIAEVASLIWTGRFDSHLPGSPIRESANARVVPALRSFAARAHVLLAVAADADPLAFDVRPQTVMAIGWRILHLLTRAATGATEAHVSIDAALAKAWRVGTRGGDVVRRALILCADHELNVSSFTARCVASAGSTPYAVVAAGLAALEGTRHGGSTARVEAMLAAMRRSRRIDTAIGERLRRGERIEGFGHPLYRDGDPRASALLALLRERYPRSPELTFVLDVAQTAGSALRDRPNLDFALAAVGRVLRLPAESALTLFAIGRSIGWIGHAIEQSATGQLIRPRARYVGVVPMMAADDTVAMATKNTKFTK